MVKVPNDSSAFLKRLRSFQTLPPEEVQSASFKLLIEEEPSIVLEYNALRALLSHVLLHPGTVDDETLTYLVHLTSDRAQILTKKYSLYINEHPSFLSQRALKKHTDSYTRWLTLSVRVHTQETQKSWLDRCIDRLHTEFTTDRMNPRRLYFLRERRLLLVLVPVMKDFAHYSSWILWADSYVAPFLVYLNLLFFLPRLAFNLYTLYDNVFDQNKKLPESNHLGLSTRFMAQWSRLWPQIMNDIGWATSGALMCFVFVGSWLPFGIYFSVAMQFYDVIMATIRLCIDLNRLNNLTEQYKSLSSDPTLSMSTNHNELHSLYLSHLEAAIQREKRLLYLAFSNATVLFIAVCLAIPFVAAMSPWLPVAGALLAIVMTVINFQLRNYLNTYLNPPGSLTLETLLEDDQLKRQSVNEAVVVNPIFRQSDVSFRVHNELSGTSPREWGLSRKRTHSGMSFFSSNTLTKSHSDSKLSSVSPSPVGVATLAHSLSMDNINYMVGGIVLG